MTALPGAARPVIALLTDFGTRDWYVGAMKAVLAGGCPDATLIDITHEIPPQDITAGAIALAAAAPSFPPSTVFLAVVDPGVGTAREPVVARAGNCFFVGPNNGLFALVAARQGGAATRVITMPEPGTRRVSSTFHGRDIFAPVAAALAAGTDWTEMTGRDTELVTLKMPEPEPTAGGARACIIHFDHFGNAYTNIDEQSALGRAVAAAPPASVRITVSGRGAIVGIRETFGSVTTGSPVAYWGSAGYLEIAVNGGSAREWFGLHHGDPVIVEHGAQG